MGKPSKTSFLSFLKHKDDEYPPIDVFLAEIRLLQHLEREETDLVKPKGLVFQTKACNLCGHTHSILSEQEDEFCVFIAGGDEPLDRNTGEGGIKHSKEAKEYRWQRLNAEEQTFFREAMNKERNSFLELEAVKIVRDALETCHTA